MFTSIVAHGTAWKQPYASMKGSLLTLQEEAQRREEFFDKVFLL